MSLYAPFFTLTPNDDGVTFSVHHNCNGGIGFRATDTVDEKTARLIQMAIAEGERRRSREILTLLRPN